MNQKRFSYLLAQSIGFLWKSLRTKNFNENWNALDKRSTAIIPITKEKGFHRYFSRLSIYHPQKNLQSLLTIKIPQQISACRDERTFKEQIQ